MSQVELFINFILTFLPLIILNHKILDMEFDFLVNFRICFKMLKMEFFFIILFVMITFIKKKILCLYSTILGLD